MTDGAGSSRPAPGSKFTSPQGTRAIKDGVRPNASSAVPDATRKPPWLRVKLPAGAGYEDIRQIVSSHRLHTVCAESKCPNIAECWGRGTATLMLMGSVCTRACRFCAVSTGNPNGWLDPMEPTHVADAVALMKLQYVVLTSVDRDDLADGGAAHYAACVRAIHERSPATAVEALTPDFAGRFADVRPCSMPGSSRTRRTWKPSSGSPIRCATRAPATRRRSACSRSPSATRPRP